MLQSKRPGDRAVLTAFVLAVVAASSPFYQVPADDRGEPSPQPSGAGDRGREQLTGAEIGDNKISLLDASGPQIFVVIALLIFVTLFALWANRRPDRSRVLTFAMLGMAARGDPDRRHRHLLLPRPHRPRHRWLPGAQGRPAGGVAERATGRPAPPGGGVASSTPTRPR